MSLGHGIPKETQQTGAETKTETEGESKARKLEASKKKDFVYSQHWRHPEMGRCSGKRKGC